MDERALPRTKPRQAAVTATLALVLLLAALGTSIANIALPTLSTAFAAPFAAVQAVVVAYLATLTLSVMIAGRLGDRYGLKPMLVAGLALFAAAAVLASLAPTLLILVGARALQGVGAAFLMTLAMALMRQTAGETRIGRAMGLLGTVSALGTALGPSLGGFLIPLAGWRGIFLVQIPLSLLALLLAATVLPRQGAGASAPASIRPAAIAQDMMPNLFVNLLVAAVMMTTLVVGPFYLGGGLGLDAGAVGLTMTVGPAISILSGVPSGRLVDRLGSRPVLLLGLTLLTAGALLLAIAPNPIGVAGYVLAIGILTPGYQLFQAANNTAALADVPPDRRGMVAGALTLSRNLGLIAGASLMGTVFAAGIGTGSPIEASPAAIAAGMRLTFVVAGLMMLAALAVTLIGGSRPRRP